MNTTPKKVISAKEYGGDAPPWIEADREWFRRHKVRDWYVRDPFDNEVAEMRASGHGPVLDALTNLALSPGAPDRTRLRVCVFQIRAGVRSRVPVIGHANSNNEDVRFISPVDGKVAVDARAMLSEYRREAHRRPVVPSPMEAEHCSSTRSSTSTMDSAGARPASGACPTRSSCTGSAPSSATASG